ncbi:MAG: hypothetical protein WAV95_18510 [Azonexus sp.]
MDEISTLLDLLTSRSLDTEELDEAAAYVRNSPEDPELEWAGDSRSIMTFAICNTLSDFVATSDKIDELHEQIEAFFSNPIPPFPADDPEVQKSSFAYFRWLDSILAQRAPEKGGYELLSVNPGLDDNLYVVVVDRCDTERILELANALDLNIYRENGVEHWQ